MKFSLITTLMLAAAPSALLAAPIEHPARVDAVTLFPWGAQVSRSVAVAEGETEVLVPNLPDGTDVASLRVSGAGVRIGAVTLIDERQPASDAVTSPEIEAARAEVERLEAALAAGEDAVAAIRAQALAAQARVAFLNRLDTSNTPPDQVATLAATVAEGVLEASRQALVAEAEARAADLALRPDREALEQARKALAALEHPARDSDAVLMQVSGAGTVTITTFVSDAGWQPAYDVRLDRAQGVLSLDRLVSVHQASGEDWSGVALTLSTARPSERSAPSELWPEFLRFGPPDEPVLMAKAERGYAMEAAPAPEADAALVGAGALEMVGETVTYRYDGAVDIRDGVEDLRLQLDRLDLRAEVLAEAVPMLDPTAYRIAEARNDSGQVLLPGPATLWLDGAVIGASQLPLVAAGAELRLGFGAIDGMQLRRIVEQAQEGDRGVISKSNERSETVRIEVENLTGEAWPVRLIDRVPYGEQEDLEIGYTATPKATEENYDDKRGLLAWRFDLGAGAKQTVDLETTIRWPAGQVLR
ncbi:DUF4139 domain-containing protein [Sinirhodobacter sp. WL0062]|uniref:DUF4139 domain-containing protein n=1 Tax=Rhodobacter flavimaris TaxID=2907145 RepID=A0ABS8YY97_9RHOB|nr:DUF4139 domain-containing protein [Sinirhodobacter sp. WL0062]MCE5973459.1 DUF4139 domain-containing protein [Sinirhodobacter sp. WL0062]